MPATCDLLLLVPANTVAVAVIKAAIIGVDAGHRDLLFLVPAYCGYIKAVTSGASWHSSCSPQALATKASAMSCAQVFEASAMSCAQVFEVSAMSCAQVFEAASHLLACALPWARALLLCHKSSASS